jgi:outer membrane receptor protein involved in Fe transport
MVPRFNCFIPILYLLFCYPIYSSEDTNVQQYFSQDSVIIIANRYEFSQKIAVNSTDLISVEKFNLTANHSVLQMVDMLSPGAFVMDKKVLGFGVGSAGGGTLNMRGMGGKPNSGILVLINGRPDFMGIFGHPLPDVYGLDGKNRIEVIKGPSSVLFGSGAMAGALNLVSSTPNYNGIYVKTEAGNYSTLKQSAGLYYHSGQTKFSGNMLYQFSDGHLDLTGFEGWSFATNLLHDFTNGWKLFLEGRYVPYKFDDPSLTEDIADLGYYGIIRRGMLDVRLSGDIGKLSNSFHLYSNLGHHRFFDGFESHDFTYGFSSYQHYKASQQIQYSIGLDLLHYGGRAKNVVYPSSPPAPNLNQINSLGSYAMVLYSPTYRWHLTGGCRFHYATIDVNRISPTAGISFLTSSNLKLFINYSEGFRLPTLQELYLFPSSNDALKPEEVTSYELGGNLYYNNQNYLELIYFHNKIDNKIQTIKNPTAPPPLIFANSGRANQWGVESKLVFQLNSKLAGQLSYSYLDPVHLTAFNPKNMFKYVLNYNYKKLAVILFGKYITDIYEADNFSSKLPNYFILNVSAKYPVGSFQFSIQLMNVLDRKYKILTDYPAAGFHFLFGINYNLSFFE